MSTVDSTGESSRGRGLSALVPVDSTTPIEIQRVDIREEWPGEARDFTPWLAEHLDVLGSHLGLGELAPDATEVPIPGGRALDVLAVDSEGAKWAIENQYGVGNHDHLTRALAYAVALECRGVVVVAEDHRDEFVAVADEWNRYSEAFGKDGIRLFLGVVEAWRIGDSAPGFRFRLVAGPNEWKVDARTSAARTQAQDERTEANHRFWTDFLPILGERATIFRSLSPRTGPYLSVSSGPFNFQVWVRADDCTVQLRIDSGDGEENQSLFEELLQHRSAVEASFGGPLTWNTAEESRACFVKLEGVGSAGWRSEDLDRADGLSETADALVKFHAALEPVLADLG